MVTLPGQHPDVVVALILRLALHKAQLRVSVAGVPLYPLLHILREVGETDVINNVPRAYQQRAPVLI